MGSGPSNADQSSRHTLVADDTRLCMERRRIAAVQVKGQVVSDEAWRSDRDCIWINIVLRWEDMSDVALQRPPARRADKGASDTDGVVTAEDAFQLFLAFMRLSRNAKHEDVPERVRALLMGGALAPRHMTTFAIVAMYGPLSVSELARREGCATTTASLLATQLADAGLVERREDSVDRRKTVISVAPSFRKDGANVMAARLAPLRRALARMGPDRARAMLEGLAILAEESA